MESRPPALSSVVAPTEVEVGPDYWQRCAPLLDISRCTVARALLLADKAKHAAVKPELYIF